MQIVHLRVVEGIRFPTLRAPGVTHEMVCFALDPRIGEYKVSDLLTDETKWFNNSLRPVNMVYQFTAENDAMAMKFIEGLLEQAPSVDTDFRPWWTHHIVHVGGGHEMVKKGSGYR